MLTAVQQIVSYPCYSTNQLLDAIWRVNFAPIQCIILVYLNFRWVLTQRTRKFFLIFVKALLQNLICEPIPIWRHVLIIARYKTAFFQSEFHPCKSLNKFNLL